MLYVCVGAEVVLSIISIRTESSFSFKRPSYLCEYVSHMIFQAHVLLCFGFLSFILFFRATLEAYGGSQARGQIGAIVAGLHQSHSNVGSEPRLRPTPQLTAMPDP